MLVPASLELNNADIASVTKDGRVSVRAIADLLHGLNESAWIESGVPEDGAEAFDFVLIDCPPSFSAATVAALYASDDVIIPVQTDLFSISGMATLLSQIDSARRVRPDIRVAGALITCWRNTPACIQGEAALRASAVPVFRQTIRRSEKVTESILSRQSLQAYSPQSAAGRDYRAFVDEFLEGVR
jgi:chromosome partitioning protein